METSISSPATNKLETITVFPLPNNLSNASGGISVVGAANKIRVRRVDEEELDDILTGVNDKVNHICSVGTFRLNRKGYHSSRIKYPPRLGANPRDLEKSTSMEFEVCWRRR